MKRILLLTMVFFSIFSYAQFPEGFEGATFPPTGWVVEDNGVGTAQSWGRTNAAGFGWVHQGTWSAMVNRDGGATSAGLAQDWLITPQVTVPANGQIRFYSRSGSNGEQGSVYKVLMSTSGQSRADFTTTLATYTELDIENLPFKQMVILLNAYAGQNVYFAFVMEVNNGLGDRWILDDVKVDQQCLTPTALNVTPFSTTANLSWTSPNPAGPWQIEYGPQGFVQGTGTIVNNILTNSYTLTRLSPLTSYSYYVRTICEADNMSPWSAVRNFTTTVAPPICGGNFVDNGGVSGQYSNNYNNTATPVVICPTNAGELVTVTFTSFNTEATWDALYVYDGPDTSSPLISSGNTAGNVPGGLAGGYWGTTIPGPFTSTHPSGCLTFVFRSDGFGTRDGWTSNITCAPPPNYCAGDHFYDNGGPTGNYTNNITSTRGYKKICPPAGQSVTVFFNSFDVADDTFSIYDGDDLATALLVGTYSGTGIIPSYTASNPAGNGCLIFVFTSNASTNASGWDASIICGPPCQSINASIAGSVPAAGADTVIRVCQNETFTLNGTAAFGASGTGATYHWNFGDGNTGTGQNVTHSYSSPGIYSISLYAMDTQGCRSVNRINQLVYVSTSPNFTGTAAVDREICLGQSTDIIGLVTPVTYFRQCAPPVSGTTFLPDGSGVSYQTSVPVDCFPLGTTLTSVSQITSVCLNMEHSYLGDLQIQLISPSGQSIILKAYTGTGGGGGGTYLGCPLDDPATGPGAGRDYCFTPTATGYLVAGATSNCGTPNGASINAGNYQPVQPFTNLIGSTLNGNWTLVVTDNLGIDNGYIFNWGINFDSSLLPTDYQFTPTIASSNWSPDPTITSVSGNQITVTPTVIGPHCYTYNVTDNFGCTYSTQVCIDVVPGVEFTDITASPTQICNGGDGVYTFTGTPNAIVTYNINGGANQTITLDGTGSATLTLTGLNLTTDINVTYMTAPSVPTAGNAITTVGGVNPNNSSGAILAAGTTANTANSTTINSSNTTVTLTLAHVVPAGTPITVSLAKNTTTGAVNIVDGPSTLLFNTGAINILQHVTFIKGTTSNTITINRANGTVFLDGVSYNYNELGCDRPLNDSASIVVYASPLVNVTPATCTANGSAIITNYNPTFTYVFNPLGPSIDASGAILNATFGTSYTVALDNVACLTSPSSFVIDAILQNLPTPIINTTPPTCLADGFSTITNYDGTATYTFTPAGPSVDATGLITGMILGNSYTVIASNTTCDSDPSTPFSNLVMLVTPVVPTVSVTPPTCTADGFATITNYDPAITYVFTPAGPTVDASGVISGMAFNTNYEVAASNGSCTSVNSAIFTIDPILVTPAVPVISMTAPTCLADGFSTITNYDATLTYVFNPAGPTVDATGLISGMTLNTLYEVTASNATCTSVASAQFNNLVMLVTPVVPTVSITAPTCTADGFATITNYDPAITYVFTPAGPTVDASGVISGMAFNTNYEVAASNGSCTSANSAIFTIDPILVTPAVPVISMTAPTCLADGFSTITNYDATLTYVFNPAGPTVDATGLISGMTLNTIYEVTASNATCTSVASAQFNNLVMLVTPVVPTVSITAPTCTADGFATITNYDPAITYVFTPAGPTVDASGVISGMAFNTNYEVAASNGSCTSVNSAIFTIDPILVTPAVPVISMTAPTCLADGFSTITNYDATLTYVFNPAGPTVDATGLISGMTLNTLYEVTASNATCTSVASAQFNNLVMLVTPVVPTVSITAPTCTADGFATITNYDPAITYVFTPAGPTVDGSGVISGMAFNTNYEVAASNGSCTSANSAIFTIDLILVTPAVPVISMTAPTCLADGFSTITNYDATLTYVFNPAGPTVDATGLISGMTLNTLYEVTASNATCTSAASAQFNNLVMLVTPVVPTVSITAPTCTADGFATITNYNAALTYVFTPAGPTVGTGGVVSNALLNTNYQVAASNGSCTSTNSSQFSVLPILPKPVLVNIVSNNAICEGTSGTITITTTPNSVVTYNIDGGANQTVNVNNTGTVTIATPILLSNSTYNVVYVQSTIAPFCGQNQSGSATVVVNPIPDVIITPTQTTICSGTSTSINLSSSVSGTTFTWVVVQQSNVTGASNGSGNVISQVLTSTLTGGYVDYLVTPTANGCVGPAQSIRINVTPRPNVTAINNNPTFCSGGVTDIQLSSNNVPGAVFSWTVTGGNVLGAAGGTGTSINQILTVSPGTTSTVEVVYTIIAEANGCSGPPQIVRVYVNPIPDLNLASSTVPLCSGDSTNISFTGTIPGTVFNWVVLNSTGVSGASNGTGTSIQQVLTATSLSQGSVTYQITPTFNGCTGASQTVTVIVNPRPELFANPIHPPICSGVLSTNIFLSTFNAGTIFNWTVNSVGVDGATDGSAPGPTYTIIQNLTTSVDNVAGYVDYIITPTFAGCSGTPITVRVVVNPLPKPVLTDGAICVDEFGVPFQSYTLDSGLDNATYDFVWYFNGVAIPNSNNATYAANAVGTYGVIATNSITNCVSSDVTSMVTANVTSVTPAVSMTVTQSAYFSGNATLTVNVTGGSGTLMYSLDEGTLQSSNVFTNVSSGPHTITVVDTQGCTYLTYTLLVIDYPHYFTPNGDGINDGWFIAGLQDTDVIYIFDRYGKLIKQLRGEEFWDGTYNQENLPSTDYWFTVDYLENGAKKQFKAHFSLKR